MSMGTLGKTIKKTRTKMIERGADEIAREFTKRFGMKDGDYIEFERSSSGGKKLSQGRIFSVDQCYFNKGGGYTAWVHVLPLLVDGKLGRTTTVYMTINEDGSGLKGIRGVVRKVQPPVM